MSAGVEDVRMEFKPYSFAQATSHANDRRHHFSEDLLPFCVYEVVSCDLCYYFPVPETSYSGEYPLPPILTIVVLLPK